MKKLEAKRIVSAAFLVLIGVFMSAVLFRFVGGNFFGLSFDGSTAAEQDNSRTADVYDWSTEFPFSDETKFIYTAEEAPSRENAEAKPGSLFSGIEQTAAAVEEKIDYYTTNLLWGRMKFVELNASFNRAVGMNIVSGTDSVVVMRNGYLTYQSYEVNTSYAAQSTEFLKNFLNKKDVNFLYVQYPAKENKFDNQLPVGIEDFYNANADSLIDRLNKSGVNTLDLREPLNREKDYYSCFFKTDHHWTPETGVWAAGKIARALNENCGYSIPLGIGSLDSYNIKVYENYCLGSQGKKATLKFADPENISLITPKQETDFTVQYCKDAPLSGSFEKTLTDLSVFDKIDYYNTSVYAAYLHGDNALTTIKNNRGSDGKRLLIISDSFVKCTAPYLAAGIEYIDVLDARYFNGSIISYIEKTKPDTVIAAYNPSSINSDATDFGTFNFN